MTKLCIVRHGQTDWNLIRRLQGREDIPLNGNGEQQAKEAAAFLAGASWAVVITSPLRRARRTAELIAAKTACSVLVDEAFIERDYGEASGLTPSEREGRFPPGNIPGSEPFPILQDRIWHGLEAVIRRYMHKRVIIVTHGGALRSLLAKVSGNRVGNGPTYLKNGGLSLLQWERNALSLVEYDRYPAELEETIDWTRTLYQKEMVL